MDINIESVGVWNGEGFEQLMRQNKGEMRMWFGLNILQAWEY